MKWGGTIVKTWTRDFFIGKNDLRIICHWVKPDHGSCFGTWELFQNGMFGGKYAKQKRKLEGMNCWSVEQCEWMIENYLKILKVPSNMTISDWHENIDIDGMWYRVQANHRSNGQTWISIHREFLGNIVHEAIGNQEDLEDLKSDPRTYIILTLV